MINNVLVFPVEYSPGFLNVLNVESTFEIEIVLIAKDIAPNEAKTVSFAQT